jgi:hypothetical protein
MKTIEIIKREKVENGVFQTELVFPSGNRFNVTVRDPFLEPGQIEADQEERLRWYFTNTLKKHAKKTSF